MEGNTNSSTSSSIISPVVHSTTVTAYVHPTVNNSPPSPPSVQTGIPSVADDLATNANTVTGPSLSRTTATTGRVSFAATPSILASPPCSPTTTPVTTSTRAKRNTGVSAGPAVYFPPVNASVRVTPFRVSFPSAKKKTRAPFIASYRAPSSAPALITNPVPAPHFGSQCNSPCDVCEEYYPYTPSNNTYPRTTSFAINTGSPDKQPRKYSMTTKGGGGGEGKSNEGGGGKRGKKEGEVEQLRLETTSLLHKGEERKEEKNEEGDGGNVEERREEGEMEGDVVVVTNYISTTSKMSSLSQDSGCNERGNWQSKWDYFLSVAGFAIGLANVWRFPYLCYMNGGGAFLVPYLLVLVLVGIPLYLMESAIGQFASSSCITIYNVCPILKGAGQTTFLVNLIFVTVYNVIIAYPLVYLGYSFTTHLPWASCSNSWNSLQCSLVDSRNTTTGNYTLEEGPLSPADEFFHNKVLELTDGMTDLGGFNWPVVGASLFIWAFVFLCVFKGINVFGKVVWFTATFPFLMLFTLLLRGLTLPGAWDGVYFYLWPDFTKLKELKVWAAAAAQIFYSLGPGWGILTTLGSYNKFRNPCLRNSLLVPLLNCSTSILAGFVVFSVLGFMAQRMNTTVDKVTAAGPSLVFITYPEALSLMPFSPLWAVLFFLMIFFLGIDSMIAHIETLTVSLVDEVPSLRPWRGLVTLLVCCVDILFSLLFCTKGGIYWLTLMDWYSASYTLILNSLCEVIVFVFIYGKYEGVFAGAGRTVRDLQMMNNERISYLWYGAWLFVTPIVLLLIFINTMVSSGPATYRGEELPGWSQAIGWGISLASMIPLPVYFLYYLTCKAKGSLCKRLRAGFTPSESWGPAFESHREEWQSLCRQQPLRHPLLHPDLSSPQLHSNPKSQHEYSSKREAVCV
ncbi:hypothetical protein Pcinc_015970 [Petrolisthes cinctipes]|uniref:Transporter n=1 Tax=Petrolisthes cinctipes TaxID=88211 RepID=A0AAE1FS01_PETCI|nr:hypothetical protein Pcinc_015970 [Petrolisthes cinctipes]